MLEMISEGEAWGGLSDTLETSITYHQVGPYVESTKKKTQKTSEEDMQRGTPDRY